MDDDGEVIESVTTNRVVMGTESVKTTQTTIPFVKNNEFDYAWFTGGNRMATWILYVLVAIFVVTAVSNGANLTDGLDGLVSGVSAPIVVVLAILAYLSGHVVYADYLNIMYIPGSGELVVFAAAFAGALIGFLWYNSFPAQTFMGDTGSLAIGGIIAVFALCIRKELLLPILCGVFFVEGLVGYDAGLLFQIYQTPLRRGTAHLPDVAHPPPLSEEGNLRDEDRHPLLDREHAAVARGARDAQNPIIKPKNDE